MRRSALIDPADELIDHLHRLAGAHRTHVENTFFFAQGLENPLTALKVFLLATCNDGQRAGDRPGVAATYRCIHYTDALF